MTTTEAFADSFALAGRHMRHIRRSPEQMLAVTVMPVAFVIVFGYLFGSAMQVPGHGGYKAYIMAGIFAQVMLAGITTTAVGISSDLANGIVDRFRSLPISPSSVLVGRTASDAMISTWTCVVMAGVGLAIGWRTTAGIVSAIGGFALLVLFGFALSWLGALIGLAVRSTEAVSAITGMILMPLAFLSNAFVPLQGLPSWLRVVAEWNPVSSVVSASRELFGNATGAVDGSFAAEHALPIALVEIAVLLAVAVPLASRAYRSAVVR